MEPNRSSFLFLAFLIGFVSITACGSGSSNGPLFIENSEDTRPGEGLPEPKPEERNPIEELLEPRNTAVPFSDPEWDSLTSLTAAERLAVPTDLTNTVADSPAAQKLGHALFFDTRFSGPLLDSDNDGPIPFGHNGPGPEDPEGNQGEAGHVSCATCHLPKSGFVDTRSAGQQLSLASGWTKRRTPALFDIGQATLIMWDGRFDSLQRQVLAVFESPLEANSSRLFVAQQIARHYPSDYEDVFGDDPSDVLDSSQYPQLTAEENGCVVEALDSTSSAFEDCRNGVLHGRPGDSAGAGIGEYDLLSPEKKRHVTTIALNMGKAIAAYERLLSCGRGRFDAFMNGEYEALSESEQRGAALFVGKAKCIDCHSGPFFSDQEFHNVGLVPVLVSGVQLNLDDEGAFLGLQSASEDPLNAEGMYSDTALRRAPETVSPEMLGAFRTPMLRCIDAQPSFMHTAQLGSLREVVSFFNEGGHVEAGESAPGFLGISEIEPLNLTEQEETDLVAFLESLRGTTPLEEALLVPPK